MIPTTTATYSDTTDNTGLNVFAVQIVADAVFTEFTGMTGFAGITYPAGQTYFGQFTRIKLASGKVVASSNSQYVFS